MLVWPSVTLFGILDANNVVFMIHTEVMKITNRRRNGPPLYLLLPPAVSRHRYCLCILQQSPPQILPPCRQRHDHHSPDADCFSPQKLRRPHFSPDGECRFYYLVRENFDRGPAGQRWVLEHFKHIQQCQSWTARWFLLRKCSLWALNKNRSRTNWRTDRTTYGRIHPHIEMGGPI